MRLYFLLIISVVVSASCKRQEVVYSETFIDGERVIVRKKFLDNGIVMQDVLNKDSVAHGYHKEWRDDMITVTGQYSNGKKEGKWLRYDLLGDTLQIENWFQGKKFGEQFEFFGRSQRTRPRIYRYSFNSVEGDQLCNIFFDQSGNVKSIKGLPLYCAFNQSIVKANADFELMAFFGIPKELQVALIIKEMDANKLILSEQIISDSNSSDILDAGFAKKYTIEKRYKSRGNYLWAFQMTMKQNSKVLYTDSLSINVVVE